MKKLLTATTALALVGGVATAEITYTGSAEFAFDYNSAPKADKDGYIPSKHNFNHDFNVEFVGSGTTDGGLTFGGSAGFDSESGASSLDEGKVFVSGAFGKITFGDNDSADKLAGGIADIGLNGIGVDDIAEKYGGTANQLRYDHTFGAVSIAVSAGTKPGKAAVPAVKATEWWFSGFNNQVHRFSADPTVMTALADTNVDADNSIFTSNYDRMFGIRRFQAAAAGSPVSIVQGTADAGNTITGVGYARDADGELILNAADEPILVTDPATEFADAAATSGTAATAAQITAYNNYVMAYSLGADNAVGGEDENADARVMDIDDNGKLRKPGTSADQQYAFGMSFNAGGVTVGVGHDSEGSTSAGLGFSTGDIGTNVLYVKGSDGNAMGADVSYAMGASTLTMAYSRYSPDDAEKHKQTGMGIGVAHDLGGGASLNAGFGQVDDKDGKSHNKASVGLSFSF